MIPNGFSSLVSLSCVVWLCSPPASMLPSLPTSPLQLGICPSPTLPNSTQSSNLEAKLWSRKLGQCSSPPSGDAGNILKLPGLQMKSLIVKTDLFLWKLLQKEGADECRMSNDEDETDFQRQLKAWALQSSGGWVKLIRWRKVWGKKTHVYPKGPYI